MLGTDVLLIIILVQFLLILVLTGRIHGSIPLEIADRFIDIAKERAAKTEGTGDDRVAELAEKVMEFVRDALGKKVEVITEAETTTAIYDTQPVVKHERIPFTSKPIQPNIPDDDPFPHSE